MEETLHRNHIYRWSLVSSCKVDVAAAKHNFYFSIYAGGNKQSPSTLATSYQATAGIRDVCVSVFSFDPDQILCFFVLSSFVFSFSHPLPVCSWINMALIRHKAMLCVFVLFILVCDVFHFPIPVFVCFPAHLCPIR